jgi:hypothetical protein
VWWRAPRLSPSEQFHQTGASKPPGNTLLNCIVTNSFGLRSAEGTEPAPARQDSDQHLLPFNGRAALTYQHKVKLLVLQILEPGFLGSTGKGFKAEALKVGAIEIQAVGILIDHQDLTSNQPPGHFMPSHIERPSLAGLGASGLHESRRTLGMFLRTRLLGDQETSLCWSNRCVPPGRRLSPKIAVRRPHTRFGHLTVFRPASRKVHQLPADCILSWRPWNSAS